MKLTPAIAQDSESPMAEQSNSERWSYSQTKLEDKVILKCLLSQAT